MDAADIKEQLEALAKDLDSYGPGDRVRWSVGKLANALLEQAKLAKPDNPVLIAIDPYDQSSDGYILDASAADVRTIVRQVAAVLPGHGPSIG